jgi:chaperonin GroES
MINAVFDNIVVKQDDTGDKMFGSIVIPDMGKELPHIGTIVDIGPGKTNEFSGAFIPTTFKVGDKVILPKIGPVRVEYDGVEYLITSEKNVLALIPQEDSKN